MKRWFTIFVFTLFVSFPAPSRAKDNQYISVVNPVRIAPYTKDPLSSLSSIYSQVEKSKLPATWLITYDVLVNPEMVKLIQDWPDNQEIGVFLEVSPSFSDAAGVKFNKSGSWHFAESVFLSGYSQVDRKKFIDVLMEKFKMELGKYPTSVGAWWIDSFSLDYLHDKYGITANLTCSDQFGTDGYKIWGQYWSAPYYPSKMHAGIPAQKQEDKLDLVTVQWAPRDPLNGYKSSIYSTQDYFTTPEKLDLDYFTQLLGLYATRGFNNFSHVVVGLEADLSPLSYSGEYQKWLEIVNEIVASKHVTPLTLSEFSSWYRNSHPTISPPSITISKDLLGGNDLGMWYQSPNYRLGLSVDSFSSQVNIVDFRVYPSGFMEPYYYHPNKSKDLSIYIPSIIDNNQNPDQIWKIDDYISYSSHDNVLTLNFKWGNINLSQSEILITGPTLLPEIISSSPGLKIVDNQSKKTITFVSDWLGIPEGYLFKDWTIEASHILSSPKDLVKAIINGDLSKIKKKTYYVSQSEIDTLTQLSRLPQGKVLTVSTECLQCSWNSPHQPAVFANHRQHISRISKHQVYSDSQFIHYANRQDAEKLLDSKGIKYIYLTSYEDYEEILPFSPGDWNSRLIYANAHTQLWEVLK